MSVTPRLRWAIQSIAATFSADLKESQVESFVLEPDNLSWFNALFAGDKLSKFFVFFQPRFSDIETGNQPDDCRPELFITDGEHESIRGRCCYFVRNVPMGVPIDVSKISDGALVFGQMKPSPLRTFEATIKELFIPTFSECLKDDDDGDLFKSDLIDELQRFAHDVSEALKNMEGGIRLREPEKILLDLDPESASKDVNALKGLTDLLLDWSTAVEGCLNEKPNNGEDDYEEDPMAELRYWRHRMQKLTSIMEFFRTKSAKNVLGCLNSMSKLPYREETESVLGELRNWKTIDARVTECANEAKDNMKYLGTLERFIEPLYKGTPSSIIDTLPALLNSIKMIFTISRYYNTEERLTCLFLKITNQIIKNCKNYISDGQDPTAFLWKMDSEDLVRRFESCLKLNESYKEQYRIMKERLQAMPKGKQINFCGEKIFGKFDLFCRRIVKLVDMFSTIYQFEALKRNKLEGMERIIEKFEQIVRNFQNRKHDLLDFHNNKFDRDYVEFNLEISDLEGNVQQFINKSFETISNVESALNLLHKFQTILQRENLKSELDSKFNVIFQNYGYELEQIQSIYESQKQNPPCPRNLPPVVGCIMWARHLLKKIEEPMKRFEKNQNVLASKDAKGIIKIYNKVARTLIAFEYLWYQAWVQSIDTSRAGLQSIILAKRVEDQAIQVNFDRSILQLIREAKCLDHMGIDVPENAKVILLQEAKLKNYYNRLQYLLRSYSRIKSKVAPVVLPLVEPRIRDIERKLKPGLSTLTWTSMNVEKFADTIESALGKFDELIININDIIENRLEKNLLIVSRTSLVDLTEAKTYALEEFVQLQEARIRSEAKTLQGKNLEIEGAVEDLIEMTTVRSANLETKKEVSQEDLKNFRRHYQGLMYQALLHCTKRSLFELKKRVTCRSSASIFHIERPCFEVDVYLPAPAVHLDPSLDEIQLIINRAAKTVLKCSAELTCWEGVDGQDKTFFELITKDIEIVRVILLMIGSVQGTKHSVEQYLSKFKRYDWLWRENENSAYEKFMEKQPSLEQYADELRRFSDLEKEVELIESEYTISALHLRNGPLKAQLKKLAAQWKTQFSENLHKQAHSKMDTLLEYFRTTTGKLNREVTDLESIRFVMNVLKEVRHRESNMNAEILPIEDMYRMLEHYLPPKGINKEERDQLSVLRSSWKFVVQLCEKRADELSKTQVSFKRQLLRDVKEFLVDVSYFRQDFLTNGPMVQNIKPLEAVERLKRFTEEYNIRERKYELYNIGEELFSLPKTEYPELIQTKKELELQDKLFSLYVDVINTMAQWESIPWIEVPSNIDDMTDQVNAFALRCKKLPARLRDWQAYNELKSAIDDFMTVLPLLRELSMDSIKPRHWDQLSDLTKTELDVQNPDFKLSSLIEAQIVNFKDEVEEITDSADKQLKIERQLEEIRARWKVEEFQFQIWKSRSVATLKAVGPVMEELEETQLILQTMLTMRHVTPFREEAQSQLKALSDTSDTLERWLKVQLLWCSLESVFTGGDIARQMPLEAKKFGKVDKDWSKIMSKAMETKNVVDCCGNDVLKTSLPVMYGELEKCQKSLEGYLEQKRSKFPRFYFVSNPGLLIILSQGSDPLSMNNHYEKVFDSIERVNHDVQDKTIIESMVSGSETVPFSTNVKAVGNIEDWLANLRDFMRATMKDICRNCAADIAVAGADIKSLRGFVDSYIAQFALLGIQLMWTADCQTALEECKTKKTIMKETNTKQLQVLSELSSWCLQDLGSKDNRRKIETLVTIHVHQRDVTNELVTLYKQRKLSDANDFEWLKQARFYWRGANSDDVSSDGTCIISISDVDFNYQYEYLGSKERLVITPLTDRCYITLAQALGMYFGGAPAGPAGTGKTETVKDLGRSLGIYVVVTNCTDQQKYSDCAKIFKGLCMGGLWGCFDEFNRIQLPVLSVVAQQVLAIQNAKKTGAKYFQFPGDPQNILLTPVCGMFITMNPGYAGRQELPENLKALFRGVAMMVPDFEIIMKVKLCSVGYTDFAMLAKKFFVLYNTCKEQLSAQKHYDWGLRNILAVLRTAGKTKRENLEVSESILMYQTLRDMNLSKLVAQDVPLFLSLLADLFPAVSSPAKGSYPDVMAALKKSIDEATLVQHESWIAKIIQLYETQLVRHGIMLVGPTGGGKTRIFEMLQNTLTSVTGIVHKQSRLNPKAIRAAEMYGEIDPSSGEWTTGVFAAMWAKFNSRDNKFITWIICDGPVDAIWIEDLNTVLDDNKILTLANGDRIPMTENVKLMFEVETLVNASPATVSRAGIVYVSDTDLDWAPVVQAWCQKQSPEFAQILQALFQKYLGECTPTDVGHAIDFLNRNTNQVMAVSRVGQATRMFDLITGHLSGPCKINLSSGTEQLEEELERIFQYCFVWAFGGLLEPEDRQKFDTWLRQIDTKNLLPTCEDGETVFEYHCHPDTTQWRPWRPPKWDYPQGEKLNFSNLLVPTMDSTRAIHILQAVHSQKKHLLMVGGSGTAKTSTAHMFFNEHLDPEKMLVKSINFSSATTPFMCQHTIESELDKRGGKNFGPPNGKQMTVFLDDLSMPLVNEWGDQPTLEFVRLLVECGGFCFLDKDKRGDFKTCEDLQYVGAMNHPGGGRNDIPNRLKRHFFVFNMVLPSITSIDDIYGQMLKGRFSASEFNAETMVVVNNLTRATISLWRKIKTKMLPTPSKFHYVFNMRDLSRVFQGILHTPKETLLTCGGICVQNCQMTKVPQDILLLQIWKHECERVFQDKLTTNVDKAWYTECAAQIVTEVFGEDSADEAAEDAHMVHFFREDIYDDDGVFEEHAPKIYEPGGSIDNVKERVMFFLKKHNEEFPSRAMELVLFTDALKHLLRISRLLEMPRGSALLVGVGGSGKQSLTKLASYMANAFLFQITMKKSYNVNSFMEDIRTLFKSAGHQRKQTTFLFTDSEIKDEMFLELINSILMTGEVAGLFSKEEMMAMCADLRNDFVAERPGLAETPANMKQYFIDCVRDNLHIVLCMSPLNPKFAVRARKFPGVINVPTIDWFLPWPEEALVDVSRGFISDFGLECENETKEGLITHMGMVHKMVSEVCDIYFQEMRRNVYQTPRSYLSFIQSYKTMYKERLEEIKAKEQKVNLGLKKLTQGAADVEAMKVILAEEQKKLEQATKDTNHMLESLEKSSDEAKREGEQVHKIKAKCEEDAVRIAAEKEQCEEDLAKAKPFVDEAETAIDSIKPAHIGEIKKLPKPSDIIKLVFDGVLILFKGPLNPVEPAKLNVAKVDVEFIETSYVPHAQKIMNDVNFLNRLQTFGKVDKDLINEETIELMLPYMELEGFLPSVAKNASSAAEGLCTWVRAMKSYHEASKIVKPKLEALSVAEVQMDAANKALQAAEARLQKCQQTLNELQSMFDSQMAEKKRIEEGAETLARKMTQASDLINGLSGERVRWTEDSNNFADLKRRLVGDCAVSCAFVSYLGPFNQSFRDMCVKQKFPADCESRNVPVSRDLDIISFLVDIATIGDWNLQGLPTDPLSIQNGILVTRSARYPLLIDPQGQALTWIREREKERLPPFGTTLLNNPKLRDQLEFCMGEGKALVIAGVEEEIDPMLDPVLEKQIIYKGTKMSITVSDKNMEYDPAFSMYFITRLPNPHFSPELQAKTTVVDFTVTMKGLEEQLLGRVISKEQKALEEQLSQVLEDVNENTKALLQLDASLLERLTSNSGNLLEDEELIGVLAHTKAKAAEVNEKLVSADETRKNINEKREQFKPVATRGSVLYFAIVEMSLVNCMYQTSLDQFLTLFMKSMDLAEKAPLASKRAQNIMDTMTYITYRYINRGLYERDKLTFVLLLTLKVLITDGLLSQKDLTLFLRGGAALDINAVRRKQFNWMSNDAWLNVIELSQSCEIFNNLPSEMVGNEAMWRRWYEDNEPEAMPIPSYEARISESGDIAGFLKLLTVRSLRMDRCLLTAKDFIRSTPQLGPRYVEPVTDTIESIYDEMVSSTPVIFLLSVGADPTESIEQLARRKKQPAPAVVSLGEGQEPVAIQAINAAAINGTWVLLQNCELGLGLMNQMEELLAKIKDTIDPSFRLFITALPSPQFPLGLLQMSTKVTNEPPAGLKAGLLRSYTVMVDQDRLERVSTGQWRILLFNLCFLHSVVQERRKFGPLGWCIPYEYNTGDLSASIQFLEKHLYSGTISWPTLQYMVSEVQYGGKITDSMDRRLFNLYASEWLGPHVCEESFEYNPKQPIFRIPGDFIYRIPSSEQIEDYRRYCSGFPEIDSPEIFGLHPNADLTYRVKEVNSLMSTLGETQPKGGGGVEGVSREDVVYQKATELLERLPEAYVEDDYKLKIRKLGGLAVPLNIFLFQEIQRLQSVIFKVRHTLEQLQMAINGEVVMTDELQQALDAIYGAKVPHSWIFTAAGDEFSWMLPTLGLWFSSLVSRDDQNRSWLESGRPKCFWLSGFFNPQGALTALKQEVTRKHKGDKWALDDVVYHTEVTNFATAESVKSPATEGIYVHGLYLDGGSWNRQEGHLVESEPKRLFQPLPVLYVSANIKTDEAKVRREMFGSIGPYECPCYKYPTRTDRYLIFTVTMKCTAGKPPSHWGLRGTALLCHTD